jgi:hypothetical protein
MYFLIPSAQPYTLLDESLAQHPDVAEQTVLTALRTWMRPRCDSVRKNESWRAVLSDAGLGADCLLCFDVLMNSLTDESCQPLDMRCRCASDLAKDEATLLQTLALLQRMRNDEAIALLDERLPRPASGVALKVARWFAFWLLDAGLEIRVRERRVTYMH